MTDEKRIEALRLIIKVVDALEAEGKGIRLELVFVRGKALDALGLKQRGEE